MIISEEMLTEINRKDAIDQVLSFTVLGITYVAMRMDRLNTLSGRNFYTTPASNPQGKQT